MVSKSSAADLLYVGKCKDACSCEYWDMNNIYIKFHKADVLNNTLDERLQANIAKSCQFNTLFLTLLNKLANLNICWYL